MASNKTFKVGDQVRVIANPNQGRWTDLLEAAHSNGMVFKITGAHDQGTTNAYVSLEDLENGIAHLPGVYNRNLELETPVSTAETMSTLPRPKRSENAAVMRVGRRHSADSVHVEIAKPNPWNRVAIDLSNDEVDDLITMLEFYRNRLDKDAK